MSVTPSGILSLPVSAVRTALSACPSFQTLVGADDATEALDSIYMLATPAPEGQWLDLTEYNQLRPFCVVRLTPREGLEGDTIAVAASTVTYRLWLVFQANTPAEHQEHEADAWFWFANQIGAIWSELAADDYHSVNVSGISLVEGPWRSAPKDRAAEGDFFTCVLSFSCWGPAG